MLPWNRRVATGRDLSPAAGGTKLLSPPRERWVASQIIIPSPFRGDTSHRKTRLDPTRRFAACNIARNSSSYECLAWWAA